MAQFLMCNKTFYIYHWGAYEKWFQCLRHFTKILQYLLQPFCIRFWQRPFLDPSISVGLVLFEICRFAYVGGNDEDVVGEASTIYQCSMNLYSFLLSLNVLEEVFQSINEQLWPCIRLTYSIYFDFVCIQTKYFHFLHPIFMSNLHGQRALKKYLSLKSWKTCKIYSLIEITYIIVPFLIADTTAVICSYS